MRLRALSTALVIVAISVAVPLHAQGLREQISELFIFGAGQDPLFLAGSADPSNPLSIREHGTHFIPSSAADNESVISFITDAVGSSVANVPVGSTSGGETFHFEGGVPVRTSTSAGPIFAERAATLGRGRVLAGANRTSFHLQTLRGVDLNNIQLNFTHENVNFPGCDAIYNDSCAKMGVPGLENDVIQVKLSLDIDVNVTSFYVTYGLTDKIDFGAVIPVVSTALRGESFAQIQPFGGTTAAHFFAGTPQNPALTANRTVQGSATGLGDVSLRAKIGLRETQSTSAALLFDARLPTGAEADLLGAGNFAGRGIAVLTSRFGELSSHINMGYLYRGGPRQNDAVLGTIGFDEQIVPHVTLATDLLSELQVGQSKLQLPLPVVYDAPFRRTVIPTIIPDTRDDIVNGSFGFKIVPRKELSLIVNVLFPLNRGGLRPGVTYTTGIEANF